MAQASWRLALGIGDEANASSAGTFAPVQRAHIGWRGEDYVRLLAGQPMFNPFG